VPEIVQGALIGIAGVIVGAISSYIVARLQINARRAELNQQFGHQEREAQINRRIETQKDNLFHLRETISEYVENSHQGANMNVRLKEAFESGDHNEKQREIDEYVKTLEDGTKLASKLAKLRGEISDNTLDNRIEILLENQQNIDAERMPLIRLFHHPDKVNYHAIEAATQKEKSLRSIQRKEVIKVNKRILELLSGEPPN